jgi:7-cyano-7-deazaguanine synthase
VKRLLRAARTSGKGTRDSIADLVIFDLPLRDLYGAHWSLSGQNVPDNASRDDAVYLPGRNALLLLKPAIWCQMRGLRQLALGVLASNPFSDATAAFCDCFTALVRQATGGELQVLRPFATLQKREVMLLGANLPLELTFSCIAPANGLHCGRCNKCAERQAAFALVNRPDPTRYAVK